MNLENKVSLVTGGANGIGRATVRELALQGSHVLFLDVDKFGIESLEKEREMIGRVQGFMLDISDQYALERLFATGSLDGINILVNNAGVGIPYSLEQPSELWQKVFSVNVDGTRFVTEQVLKQMKMDNQLESIVFVTSIHTAQAFENDAAYDSSKHALVGMMRVLALDLGARGIRVNAVAPGSIYHAGRTGLLSQEQAGQLGKRVPLGRLGEPEEIAKVIAFIASKQASYIHGAEIRVDGGLSVKNSLL